MEYWRRRGQRQRGGTLLVPVSAWYNATGDITSCIAYYQSRGAASYADSLVNLANPGTYDLSEGTAPPWDAMRGWKFDNALQSYLQTGITPESDFSYVVKFANLGHGQDGNSLYGSYDAGLVCRTEIWESESFDGWLWAYGTQYIGKSPLIRQGVIGISQLQPYVNGVPGPIIVPGSSCWTGTGQPIYLGAINSATLGLRYCITADIHAFAVYDAPLTEVQMKAVMSAVSTL